MQDTAGRFARQFAKAMCKAGRPDLAALEGSFAERFREHQRSEMYRTYREKYPSMGVEKVYFGITLAQLLTEKGHPLDEVLAIWERDVIGGNRRVLERFIRLIDRLGLGYRVVAHWLDQDKQARDRDGSILYEQYHYDDRSLEYKIHTCMYVELFAHYGIRPFCKAFCNNDLCMAVLERSGRFIRYSDKVDGAYCHDVLLNTSKTHK